MKYKLFTIAVLMAFLPVLLNAQAFKVDYKTLPEELFPGGTSTICILEDELSPEKLFDKLSDYGDIKRKFNSYSTANLIENKDLLKIDKFNPDDAKFLDALNEQLSIEYVVSWKQVPDSNGVYELSVYSTANHKRLHTSRFRNSVNSNPFLDANKLLIQNVEPVYSPILGELEVTGGPEDIHYSLFQGDKLIKEWTGNGKQKFAPGKYKLVSQAENYVKDERDIELAEDKPVSLQINLNLDLSLFPRVVSGDDRIKNIRIRPDKDALKIIYDLSGDKGDEYDVKLLLNDSLKNITSDVKSITGDLKGVKPKANNVIAWLYKKDMEKGSPPGRYNVLMQLEEKGGIPWYYYAGGAVAVGAGAAVLLMGKKGENGAPASGGRTAIQPPPSRP